MMGTLGEQNFGSDSVWVTKTHAPKHSQPASVFSAEKIICVTRNPIEVFPSFASLMNTGSHSLEPENPWNTYEAYWDQWIRFQAPIFE